MSSCIMPSFKLLPSRVLASLPVFVLLLTGCGAVPVQERLRGRQAEAALKLGEPRQGSAGPRFPAGPGTGGVPEASNHSQVRGEASNQSRVQANRSQVQGEASNQSQVQGEASNRSQVHELEAPLPEKSKIVLTLLEIFLLGTLGVDRCYMGQCGLGVIKGLTLGALGIWMVTDYVVVMLSALNEDPRMDNLGFRAVFPSGDINSALGIAIANIIVIALLTCLGVYLSTRASLFVQEPELRARGDAWRKVYESMNPGENGIPCSALQRALRERRWSEADIRRATASGRPVTYERFKAIMEEDH